MENQVDDSGFDLNDLDDSDEAFEELLAKVGTPTTRAGDRIGKQHFVAKPIAIEFVRLMDEKDLLELAKPRTPQVRGAVVKKLQWSHHRLARLVALGQKGVDISKMSGYSQQRISLFRGDPMFQELVAYYHGSIENEFREIQEEIKELGMDALSELKSRLDDNPEEFTIKQLTDIGFKAIDQVLPKIATPNINQQKTNVKIEFVNPPKRDDDVIDIKANVEFEEDGDDLIEGDEI